MMGAGCRSGVSRRARALVGLQRGALVMSATISLGCGGSCRLRPYGRRNADPRLRYENASLHRAVGLFGSAGAADLVARSNAGYPPASSNHARAGGGDAGPSPRHALHLPPHFEVMVGRTRAANKARPELRLQFATGDYLVIYDADDRPDRTKLRQAAVRFRDAPRELLPPGASHLRNVRKNWLSKPFSIEYGR